MKIYVAGSLRRLHADSAKKQQAIEAYQLLGREIATKGHTLIVKTDDPMDADRYVLEGLNKAPAPGGGKHDVNVWVGRARDRKEPFSGSPEGFSNVKFLHIGRSAPERLDRMGPVAAADAVIVLAGGSGAARAGFAAQAIGKPVVAVASFEGGGKDVWETARPDYDRYGMPKDDIDSLEGSWSPRCAEIAVRFAQDLASRMRSPRWTWAAPLLFLVGIMALLGLWIAGFWWWGGQPNQARLFIMAGVGSILGSVLRGFIGAGANDPERLRATRVLNDVSVGLGVAFITTLIYLIGGLALTGGLIQVEDGSDFARVNITVTLLGVIGGFLSERSADWVQKQLAKLWPGE